MNSDLKKLSTLASILYLLETLELAKLLWLICWEEFIKKWDCSAVAM
jgi:hypothetical protein